MKVLKIIFMLWLSISFPCLVQAQSDSWWLNATFEPLGNTISGLHISRIDTNWSNAMVLTMEMMPEESMDDFHQDEINYNFSIENDFNNDGQVDLAQVGVFRNNQNETGMFLVILTDDSNGYEVVFLSQSVTEPSFSMIWIDDDNKLNFNNCFDCGHFSTLEWKGNRYEWVKYEIDPYE